MSGLLTFTAQEEELAAKTNSKQLLRLGEGVHYHAEQNTTTLERTKVRTAPYPRQQIHKLNKMSLVLSCIFSVH